MKSIHGYCNLSAKAKSKYIKKAKLNKIDEPLVSNLSNLPHKLKYIILLYVRSLLCKRYMTTAKAETDNKLWSDNAQPCTSKCGQPIRIWVCPFVSIKLLPTLSRQKGSKLPNKIIWFFFVFFSASGKLHRSGKSGRSGRFSCQKFLISPETSYSQKSFTPLRIWFLSDNLRC